MKSKTRLLVLIGIAAIMGGVALLVRQREAAVRQAKDSPVAAQVHDAPGGESLLLRELPRQALALAAERAKIHDVDRRFTPRLAPGADTVSADTVWEAENNLRVRLLRAGEPVGTFEMKLTRGKGDTIPHDQVATALAPLIDKGVFADAVGAAKLPAMGTAATPPDVEAMLGRVNYFDAFRAARLTHASVAIDGESPARLSALARAYTNLGESTRPLLGPQFDACFARALLYAERLVIAKPGEPASYWTRAYVRAIVGLTGAAEDVAKARSLPGDAPDWAPAIASLVKDDTIALLKAGDAQRNPSVAALTAHCAMRTVEFGGLDAIAIRFGDKALEQDPTDLHAMLVVNDSSGVGSLHRTTEAMPVMINRGFNAIAEWPEVPESVKNALLTARQARFDEKSRLALWAALDTVADDRNPLPWATLAELARETSFILAQRRLHFVTEKWGVDGTETFDGWWPVVKDHPAAPLFESYLRDADFTALKKLENDTLHTSLMPVVSRWGKSYARVKPSQDALFRQVSKNADMTIYDMQERVWSFRGEKDTNSVTRMSRMLFEAAPDDTVALAAIVRYDWPAVSARADELRAMSKSAPHLAWRIGEQEVRDHHLDAAIQTLNGITDIAPTTEVYQALADAYRAKGDVEGIVRSLDEYLKNGEDYGLDHAMAANNIAQELMLQGDVKRALPYSQRAAQSYAGWALTCYAENLARVGQYDEARAVFAANAERYDVDLFPQFFNGLIIPQFADAASTAWATAKTAEWSQPRASDTSKRRLAVMHIVAGDLDAAAKAFESDSGRDGLIAVTSLACVQLMRGDEAAALAVLDRIEQINNNDDFNRPPHKAAAKRARAILAGEKPGTLLEAADVFRNSASDNSKSTAAALMGLACQRKGHVAEAEQWFRYAVRSTGIGPGRAIAAIRLREAKLPVWP